MHINSRFILSHMIVPILTIHIWIRFIVNVDVLRPRVWSARYGPILRIWNPYVEIYLIWHHKYEWNRKLWIYIYLIKQILHARYSSLCRVTFRIGDFKFCATVWWIGISKMIQNEFFFPIENIDTCIDLVTHGIATRVALLPIWINGNVITSSTKCGMKCLSIRKF